MGEDPFITVVEVLAALGSGRMGVEFAVTNPDISPASRRRRPRPMAVLHQTSQ